MTDSAGKPPHRRKTKARTGCWSCKQRKVKCSEERPVCRACARLRLPCQYELRLKWHTEAADRTAPSSGPPGHTPRPAGAPLHFVHFLVQDFDSAGDRREDPGDTDAEGAWNADWDSTTSSAALALTDSPSPSSECTLLHEPSWFSPLDISSPLDEMLFMYYVIEICPRCTMFDDSSNGFGNIIIPMSANHQSIMHSVLAVAAFYKRRHAATYGTVSLKQKENALIHVRAMCFGDDAGRDYEELIVVAIMLCVFEIKDGSGPVWAKHLHGGQSILQSRVRKRGSQMWAGGLSWWANKFFGYLAIHCVAPDENQDTGLLETPEFWLSQGFGVEDIDGFLGCSSELMAITASICALARARSRYHIHPSDLEARGNELECQLFDVTQRSSQLSTTLQESSDLNETVASFLQDASFLSRAKILALTAEARHQAAFVLLFVCVRDIPIYRLEVQTRVANCLACIVAVARLMASDDSPVWGMTPLLWPLFIAGASSLADEQRFQVVEVFDQLRRTKCLGNVARAEATVKTIWKQYDMEVNVKQAELWKLYVDPNLKWPLSLA